MFEIEFNISVETSFKSSFDFKFLLSLNDLNDNSHLNDLNGTDIEIKSINETDESIKGNDVESQKLFVSLHLFNRFYQSYIISKINFNLRRIISVISIAAIPWRRSSISLLHRLSRFLLLSLSYRLPRIRQRSKHSI